MRLSLPAEPREIVMVRMSALGDVIPALPVATALKRAYPNARLTWVIQPLPHRLIQNHPAVDRFILFHRHRGLSAWRSIAEVAATLRAQRYDLVLDLQIAFKAGLVTALLRAPVKIGVDRARSGDLNWLFTTHRLPPRPIGHIQDEYLEFVEYLGIDPHPLDWGLRFSAEEEEARDRFFDDLGRPACAIVVGTSRLEKNWPPSLYARLIDALDAEFGLRSVLVGGPSAVERAAAETILASTGARPVNALGDDVRRLAYLLSGSDLVVSPDTGPLHIARALDVPVVGLYGFTNPKRWGPYRKYQDLVVDGFARTPGEPYGLDARPRPDGMSRITVDAVLEKVALALERYVEPAR